MESCNAKSCVNNTNEHWIYTCSFTHLEGGQGNVKECGLHFGYSWGTLTGRWCESPVFHWCRSHTVQPCNHKTPKIDISTSFFKVYFKVTRKLLYPFNIQKAEKMISTFFVSSQMFERIISKWCTIVWNWLKVSFWYKLCKWNVEFCFVFIHGMVSSPTLDIQNRLS